jgi:hypothetical protein
MAVSHSLSHSCAQLQRIEIPADAHRMKVKALNFNCKMPPPAMLRTVARFCSGRGDPCEGRRHCKAGTRKEIGLRRMNP